MIIAILLLVGGIITFGDRNGIYSLQSTSETRIHACMLHSGKRYQPEPETVSEMSSEVTELLKAWTEESHKQEQRQDEERRRYEEE